MLDENQAQDLIGRTVYSDGGEKIGKVGQVFLDDQTGRPEFLTVNTGMFGNKESFVPVDGASVDGENVTIPHSKSKVKDAPHVDLDSGHLDEPDERRLYEYYGRSYGDVGAAQTGQQTGKQTGKAQTGKATKGAGHDTSGPTTDDAMTRSEEHLKVDKSSQAAGRVRLRKYVTTETETHTIPVRKEKAVLEREPITDSNVGDAVGGPDISEEEHEVVLREERPVVEKTVEPVERVRLGTETTVEDETVTESVRKENVETDGDLDDRR